jgi:plastocyanin
MLSMLALWLVAVPMVSAGNPCFHDFKMPATSSGSDTEIKLEPCAFAPTVTSVAVGSTVTFRNGPTFAHLITGANQAWGSREVEVQPNKTVAYAFDKAGTYPYACALHPGMSGVIVVGDTASAGTGAAGVGAATPDAPSAGSAAATSASTTDSLGLVAISAGVGLVVGAVVVWVSMRRRTVRRDEPVAGIA